MPVCEIYQRLSEIGFVHSVDEACWKRASDGAGITDECLDDLMTIWPQFTRQALKLLERHKHISISVTIDPETGVMQVTLAGSK